MVVYTGERADVEVQCPCLTLDWNTVRAAIMDLGTVETVSTEMARKAGQDGFELLEKLVGRQPVTLHQAMEIAYYLGWDVTDLLALETATAAISPLRAANAARSSWPISMMSAESAPDEFEDTIVGSEAICVICEVELTWHAAKHLRDFTSLVKILTHASDSFPNVAADRLKDGVRVMQEHGLSVQFGRYVSRVAVDGGAVLPIPAIVVSVTRADEAQDTLSIDRRSEPFMVCSREETDPTLRSLLLDWEGKPPLFW